MKLNGVDIKTFGAVLKHYVIQPCEIAKKSEWPPGSLMPVGMDYFETAFKTLSVSLVFMRHSTEAAADHAISNLTSKLLGSVDIEIPGQPHRFKCALSGTPQKTYAVEYAKMVPTFELQFVGYEYGDQQTETINRAASKTINVPGNALSPCIVEITPVADIPDLTITGLGYDPQKDADQPIKFTKIQKGGQKVIVDGEKGLVTLENGSNKYGDTDMWLFPRLRPGANTITVSRNNVDITLRYCPRFI